MVYIPFLRRVGVFEWPVLILSFFLVTLESIMTIITSFLPTFVIMFFTKLTRFLFSLVPSKSSPYLDDKNSNLMANKIRNASGFVEMCSLFGYDAEEHIVRTEDGFLLGIHRIGGPKHSNWRKYKTRKLLNKPVVYLHHGLLMNSEIWVTQIEEYKNLPFVLAELGYDVWLGNNRGNKYSRKHIKLRPTNKKFWDFSIDDFALYDIPNTVDYILNFTKQQDLTYVGFSQGSAQCFAALSINPQLNAKINKMIALAPAYAPNGLHLRIVDSLMKASPSMMYLFFGTQCIMESAAFWQGIMYSPLFVKVIDSCLIGLFNWHGNNISFRQKIASYAHLYSYTSVKSVVHWFQIIRNKRFQMFDDSLNGPISGFNSKFYKVAPFPTENIQTPIYLLYGKSDSLVNIEKMTARLPYDTKSIGFDGYEHLEMIWSDEVDKLVFPQVIKILSDKGDDTFEFSETVAETESIPQNRNINKSKHENENETRKLYNKMQNPPQTPKSQTRQDFFDNDLTSEGSTTEETDDSLRGFKVTNYRHSPATRSLNQLTFKNDGFMVYESPRYNKSRPTSAVSFRELA